MTQPSANTASPDPELPRWTLARMDVFIRTLQRTRNVAAAARAAGMSRQAAYALRARLPGHPFDQAWAAAMAPRLAFARMMAGYGAVPDDTGCQAMTGGFQAMTGGDTG